MWNLTGARELKVGVKQRYSFLTNFWLYYARRHKGFLISLAVLGFGLSYVFLPDNLGLFTGFGRIDQYCKGIANSMNFCYLNSDLQFLSSSSQFIKYLNSVNKIVGLHPELFEIPEINVQGNMSSKQATNYLHLEVSKFIHQLNLLKFSRCTLSNYHLSKILNSHILLNLYEQQDSYEFLQILIDLLEKEYKEILSVLKDRDDLKNQVSSFPFNGKSVSQMKCLKCGGVSKPRKLEISTMSLILSKDSQSLQSLIQESKTSLLDDYNCVQCKMCHLMKRVEQGEIENYENDKSLIKLKTFFENNDKRIPINYDFDENKQDLETLNAYLEGYSSTSQVLKNEEFYELPKILAIQISRGRYSLDTGALKNYNSLNFNEDLAIDCGKNTIELETIDRSEAIQESSTMDFEKGQLDTSSHGRKDGFVLFQLRSFIGHSGNHYHGHFQCFKKKPMITKEKMKESPHQKGKHCEYHVRGEFVDTEYLGLQGLKSDVLETTKGGCKNGGKTIYKVKGDRVIYEKNQSGKKGKRKKPKILSTVINYPYWRISDSSVCEADLLVLESQRKNVYMLLYESSSEQSMQTA